MAPTDVPAPRRNGEEADNLREQAANCRRLSIKARTLAGAEAMKELGKHFDDQARKLDPASMRR